jgi:hypothetical protein
VRICSVSKKEIKSKVHKRDLRCAKGVGVSFLDLNVCKRSLRGFLVLKVRYEAPKVCDATKCIVLT